MNVFYNSGIFLVSEKLALVRCKMPETKESVQPEIDTNQRITIVIPPNKDKIPYLIPNPDNPNFPGIRLREGVIHLSDSELRLLLSRL